MTARSEPTSQPQDSPGQVTVIEMDDPDAGRALRRAQRATDVAAIVLTGTQQAGNPVQLSGRAGKPLVVALNGHIDIADLELACLCDARVATPDTVLDTTDIDRSGLLPALADLIGVARLADLLVPAAIPAKRLCELGLLNQVAEDHHVTENAVRYARGLAAAGAGVLALMRDRRLPDASPAARSSTQPVEASPTEGSGPSQPDLRVVPGARSGAQTRQKILDAAAYVLRTRGYTACRLADIAKLCGTHQTSVYHYFPSKEALVDEVLRVGVTGTYGPVRATVEALPPEATELDRLAAAVRAHLRVVLSSGDYATAAMTVTGELPKESLDRIRDIQHEYGQYWAGLFAEASAAGYLRPGTDLSVTRSFIAGALNYAIEWYDPAKSSVDELADQFIPMILGGLADPARIAGTDLTAIGRAARREPDTTSDAENDDEH